MNAAGWPFGLIVAIVLAALLLTLVGCGIAMTRLPFERRARFARFLGKAFVVLIALGAIAGMLAQFIK